MTSLIHESTPNRPWYKSLGREFSRALVNYAHLGSYIEPFVQDYQPFWSPEGHRAQIVRIRHQSPKVFSILMRPSTNWPGFQAGQFIELFIEQNGRRIGRCFSISSSPASFRKEGTIELTIRVQEQGRVTPHLQKRLRPGQFVGISKPQGDFILRSNNKPTLLIAGGSGITPFRSMLEEFLHHPRRQNIKLIYYAYSPSDHLFKEELGKLSQKHPQIEVHLISTQQEGRISFAQLKKHGIDSCNYDIYLCGPSGMIQSAQELLKKNLTAQSDIFLEHFGAAPVQAPEGDKGATVYFSNAKQSINSVPAAPQTLLTLAEQSGLEPKSGCRMGLCGQCVCTKEHGVVYNTKTGRQSDARAENIKLCISVPMGDVTLDL